VTDTATPAASYLTQEAYDRLKGELDQLSGEGRTDISKKIEAARDEGDLKENGGYHAAKEEQGKMEHRIRLLTQLLENATVGHAPPDHGIVEPGMVVTVELFGDELTFLLGNREIAGGLGSARVQRKVAAGQGHPWPEGRQGDQLPGSEGQRGQGQGPRRQAVCRLSAESGSAALSG